MPSSRVSKAYVSAYTIDRVQVTKGQRGAKRNFECDFNGALDPDVSLSSVTWRANYPWSTIMGTPTIGARTTSVPVTFGYGGCGDLKCEATLDNGDVMTLIFDVTVMDWPWFDQPFPATSGPYSVTVTAP